MKPKSQQRNNDHIRNFFITSFFFIHATCCIKNDIRRNYFFYSRSQCLSVLQTTSVSGFMTWWHSSFAAGIIWPASSVRMHSSSLVIKPPPHVLEHLRIPKLSYWSCSMKNLSKEKKEKAVALLMKFLIWRNRSMNISNQALHHIYVYTLDQGRPLHSAGHGTSLHCWTRVMFGLALSSQSQSLIISK